MEEYTSTDKAPHSLKTPIDQTLRRETVEKDLQIPSRDPISSIRTRSDPGATPSLANLNVHTLNVEEGDESNPHNWPKRTKYIHTIIISLFVFISPASSSMVAPALVTIAHDLHIVQAIQSQLVVSTFVLTYSIGPLLMAPLSEIYGRLPVLQAGSLLYVVFNTACGASRSTAQLLAFRALSGIGASAPLAVGIAIISDCFRAEERGTAISLYNLAPLLGPSLGAIIGGFVTDYGNWRWIFYATSIAEAVLQCSSFLYLSETHSPTIEARRSRQVRNETPIAGQQSSDRRQRQRKSRAVGSSLLRPLRLLSTQPIVQILSLWYAYLYGVMYLVISTYPRLWTDSYNERVSIGGVNYVSLGLGYVFGSLLCTLLLDRIYLKLKTKNRNKGRPEFRLPLMVPASLLVPVGIFAYGWSAQVRTHWIVPNIGVIIFSVGTIISYQCITNYLVDAYPRYAASATGAVAVLRGLTGFGFPLFAPYMYDRLGYGWGNSTLGFIAIIVGVPAPFIFWIFGQDLRAASPYAAGEGETEREV